MDKTFTPHPVIFALFRFDLNSSSSNTVKVAKTLNASHISMLKWSAFPLKHATGNTMSEFIAENRGADAIPTELVSRFLGGVLCRLSDYR
ncbi:hypothetical protein ABHM18_001023 [Escherichia coli]